MIRRLSELEFEFGDDWVVEDVAPGRLVAHDPHGAEVIVSTSLLVGAGAAEERQFARAKLIANALQAAAHANAHPELEVTIPIAAEERPGFTLHWGVTLTRDRTTLFAQVICAARDSVVILTFEAPNAASALKRFAGLRDSIRARWLQ